MWICLTVFKIQTKMFFKWILILLSSKASDMLLKVISKQANSIKIKQFFVGFIFYRNKAVLKTTKKDFVAKLLCFSNSTFDTRISLLFACICLAMCAYFSSSNNFDKSPTKRCRILILKIIEKKIIVKKWIRADN